jgi:hypothetical protein
MKDKGHFYISLIKSLLRIAGCIYLTIWFPIILPFSLLFLGAEVLGILEEIADRR